MGITSNQDIKYENLRLLSLYRQSQSLEMRNQIVQMNFGLVRREAHHYAYQAQENYEDLLQVGCIGLINAIERFDATKGNAFSSFAMPYIRGEIQHYLRDRSNTVRIPRRWLTLQQQSLGVVNQLRSQLQRQPTDTEIAEALEISHQEWQDIKLAHQNRKLVSLDVPVKDGEDSSTCLGELMPDSQYRSFQLAQEDQIRIQQALIHLEDQTRRILEFVFLHDLTQKEVAEQLDISVVTVSRRLKKGLDTMKKLLAGADE
ncbi:MAG: RNA polymerase sigma factor SigF [Coleofasciculaceae cyanobacterium SM2_1_6]|nr:RNA polymerase sigma factor SigF [Coleofasciculaceae cyanobacterium SM2_1_6]